jgi:hypothetical protein
MILRLEQAVSVSIPYHAGDSFFLKLQRRRFQLVEQTEALVAQTRSVLVLPGLPAAAQSCASEETPAPLMDWQQMIQHAVAWQILKHQLFSMGYPLRNQSAAAAAFSLVLHDSHGNTRTEQ